MFVSHSKTSRAIGATVSAALAVTMAAALSSTSEAAQPARPHTDDSNAPSVTQAFEPDFVPADSLSQVLRQPDGTTFRATLSPARTGGLFEVGGYSVSRDAAGVWRYVTGRDASGDLELSDVAAGSAVPAGIAKRAGRTPTEVNAR